MAQLKASNLYENSVIVFSSDNGGAVADGAGPPAPAPAGSGNGQEGAMNNYPLRGGKSSYFEGGVRVASFVHSPLLPAAARGSVYGGVLAFADWWGTFASLAGLKIEDKGFTPDARFPLSKPWGCKEHGLCSFDLDSVDQWAAISGISKTAPRTELMLGIMSGGALLDGKLKYVEGVQAPDWWYGSHSPNCTSDTGSHNQAANCGAGCLYDLSTDVSEHVNLKDKRAADFARLKKRFQALKQSVHAPDDRSTRRSNNAVAAEPEHLAGTAVASAACEAMWKRGGFWGPYAGASAPPTPAPAPSADCSFVNAVDFKDGSVQEVDASSATECCAACKAYTGAKPCLVAVFVPGKGRCFLKAVAKTKVLSAGRVACERKMN